MAFQAQNLKDGTFGITLQGLNSPIALNSGKLQAMTKALNETLPAFRDRLRDLSREIVRTVDQQHAQGMSDQVHILFCLEPEASRKSGCRWFAVCRISRFKAATCI